MIKSLPEYLDSKWQAFDSLNFTFEEIQFKISGIHLLDPRQYYMFNGSPDAILTKVTGPTSVVTSVIGDDESDESFHFVLESKRQAQVMMQLHGKCVPKKLGQLIAGMHSVLCMQVFKAVVNDQDIIDHHLSIRGIVH